jgi:hypothetical protein
MLPPRNGMSAASFYFVGRIYDCDSGRVYAGFEYLQMRACDWVWNMMGRKGIGKEESLENRHYVPHRIKNRTKRAQAGRQDAAVPTERRGLDWVQLMMMDGFSFCLAV